MDIGDATVILSPTLLAFVCSVDWFQWREVPSPVAKVVELGTVAGGVPPSVAAKLQHLNECW